MITAPVLSAYTPVCEIALEPGGARVLDQHRIEYCLDGGISLGLACARAQVPVDAVLLDLEDTLGSGAGGRSDHRWLAAPLGELASEIVRVHHAYARAALERIARLLAAARAREEAAHPELARVQELVAAFADEFEPHMLREELHVFPLVVAVERAARGAGPAPRLAPEELQAALDHEHFGQVEVLRELRRLTFGFQPPDDATLALRMLYQELERLEADLVRHMHLENNVLFPRARALARGGCA